MIDVNKKIIKIKPVLFRFLKVRGFTKTKADRFYADRAPSKGIISAKREFIKLSGKEIM